MKTLLIWMWLSQGADVATTCHAINSGRFVEANSILPNSCMNIGLTKIGVASLVTAVGMKSEISHPKLAKFMVTISAASSSVAFSINLNNITGR